MTGFCFGIDYGICCTKQVSDLRRMGMGRAFTSVNVGAVEVELLIVSRLRAGYVHVGLVCATINQRRQTATLTMNLRTYQHKQPDDR